MPTGTIAAVADTFVVDVNVNAPSLALTCEGTFAGINCAFEAIMEGATTWFPVEAVRNIGTTVETTTGALSATPAYSWDISCGGFDKVRVRCTARTSGSQTWYATPYAAGVEQAPVVSTIATVSSATLAAGSALAADVGQQYRANATGAATPFYLSSPASPSPTAIKAAPGRVIAFHVHNKGAALRSVKLFNTTAGRTIMGTTSAVAEFNIPSGGVMQLAIEGGIGFSNAITVAVTGAAGLTDNTAITAADVVGTIFYA